MRIGASTAILFAPRLPRSRSAHRGNRPTLLPAASVVWRPSLGLRGDDRLKGRRAADVIVGGKGVDEIYGLGDDDLICGGFKLQVIPNDEVGEVVVGDRIFAGPGDDRVRGNPNRWTSASFRRASSV
jgi:RTX calcium-binding nonapeptide repeat (4 copies)